MTEQAVAEPTQDAERLQSLTTSENITVAASGLSALQKRVLVYARKRMLERGQTNEPPPPEADRKIKIYLTAPDWLSEAIVGTFEKISYTRRTHLEEIGGKPEIAEGAPLRRFFIETNRMVLAISQALVANDRKRDVQLDRLFEILPQVDLLCLRIALKIGPWATAKVTYEPWPDVRNGRLVFILWVPDTPDMETELKTELADYIDKGTAELGFYDRATTAPINCTIPEMLRDLYNFPMSDCGHIDALAFNTEDIGKARYNRANAALRRACDRLWHRRLIWMRLPSRANHFASWDPYRRTGIGLTEAGVVAADKAMAA